MHTLSFFFQTSNELIGNMHLVPRERVFSGQFLSMILLCIGLLSFVRYRQKESFTILVSHLFLFESYDYQLKEGKRQSRENASLMFLNFGIVSTACISWFIALKIDLIHFHWTDNFLLALAPFIFCAYQLMCVWLAGFFVGSRETSSEINYSTLSSYNLAGIILLFEFFFFYFQPQLVSNIKWYLIGTFLFFIIIRLIRCFFIAIKNEVPWYYIFLYFWTLEILPILVIYKLIVLNPA